jgi:hypothetical protein
MPGNPKAIGDPPMCSDAAMQWAADFKAHKPKPSSDSNPYATTSPPDHTSRPAYPLPLGSLRSQYNVVTSTRTR